MNSTVDGSSLYVYVASNPTNAIGPFGRTIVVEGPPDFKLEVQVALRRLERHTEISAKNIRRLRESRRIHIIRPGPRNKTSFPTRDSRNGVGTVSSIEWVTDDRTVGSFDGKPQDIAAGLAHELPHAADVDAGAVDTSPSPEPGANGSPIAEAKAIKAENEVCAMSGNTIRPLDYFATSASNTRR